MPQLMPLYWMFYVVIFFVLVFMFKKVYSLYYVDSVNSDFQTLKITKNLWFW